MTQPPLLYEQDDQKEQQRNASLWRDEWPEFRTSEGILTLAAGVGTGLLVLYGPIEHPRWEGPILFDGAIRDGIRASSPETRKTYQTVGDWTYRLSPLIPLVDAMLVSTVGHHDKKLALNLTAITFEAYAYSGLSSFVSTEISARARPDAACTEADCKKDTQSFFSGHTSIAATGAGLVCANHTRMALYGNPVADAAACVLATTNAVVTGVTRMVADRHYATDIVAGFGVGFGFGYAIPVMLHYSYPKAERTVRLGPVPACGPSCLGLVGTF